MATRSLAAMTAVRDMLQDILWGHPSSFPGETLANPVVPLTTISSVIYKVDRLWAIWNMTCWLQRQDAQSKPNQTVKELLVEVERVFGP